jgi:hypothetical protein
VASGEKNFLKKKFTLSIVKCPVLRQGSWLGNDVGPRAITSPNTAIRMDPSTLMANVLRHNQQVVLDLSRKTVLTPPQQRELTEAQQLIAEMVVTQHPQTAQQ